MFGTPTFRLDLVSPTINFTPTIQSRSLFGLPLFSFPSPHAGGTFAQVKVLGSLAEFDFVTRNNDVTADLFLFELAYGLTAVNYTYRIPQIMGLTRLS